MPQDFKSVSDHFGTLCIKRVIPPTIAKSIFANAKVSCAFSLLFLDFYGIFVYPSENIWSRITEITVLTKNSNSNICTHYKEENE